MIWQIDRPVDHTSFGPNSRNYYIGGWHPLFDPEKFWEYANNEWVWVTADKKHLFITELSDAHLLNLKNWLENKLEILKEVFVEARDMGLVPEGTVIRGLNDFILFRTLNEEAQKRGLGSII